MENASKALLIAAAVLIVIALIAFAVQVFNSTKDVTEDVTPTADWLTLKTTVNAIDIQFSKYNGNQKGSTIHKMLEEVAEYNKKESYVAGDNTTQLKRKISVVINRNIIPNHMLESLGTVNNPSNTGWDNILRYKNYIDEDSNYNVLTKEYLDFDKDPTDEYTKKNAIYIIMIGF